jgi:glycosyltransferase involved in cell wall biosynthesis
MTSCKRLTLFRRTVNSFIQCCTDLGLVDEWICIDDNSSDEDREEMQQLYPFMRFIFKSPADKGHARSMNVLKRETAGYRYVWHMEDDFYWYLPYPYLSRSVELLAINPSYGQCLANFNYTEIEQSYITGGIFHVADGTNYILHEYHPESTMAEFYRKYAGDPQPISQCAYWPHFSFRPGLNRRSMWETVGDFHESAQHFEMEYAHRYVGAGYRSIFLPLIACRHIGRLTSDRHDTTKPNAYQLNGTQQF